MNLPDLPYLKITKNVATIVVGLGTSRIVKGIIANNTVADKTVDKVAIYAATVVVSAMVAKATANHTEAEIDKAAAWFETHVASKFRNEETPNPTQETPETTEESE
jgi:hypothetical protein